MEESKFADGVIVNNEPDQIKKINWWSIVLIPLLQIACIFAIFLSSMFLCFDSCDSSLIPVSRFFYFILIISPFLSFILFIKFFTKEKRYPWFSVVINFVIPILILISGIIVL